MGKRVKRLRLAAGFTQVQAAHRAGLNQPTWSAVENGKIGNPGSDFLARAAAALGVSAGELLGHQPTDTVSIGGWADCSPEVQAAVRTLVLAASGQRAVEEEPQPEPEPEDEWDVITRQMLAAGIDPATTRRVVGEARAILEASESADEEATG